MSSMKFSDIFGDAAEARNKDLATEMMSFQECVKGNRSRLLALAAITAISGHHLDPESCVPVPQELVQQIGQYAGGMVIKGMERGSGYGQWSCGFMGSRWFDIDPEKFGVDSIRCAFYSKANYKGGVWPHDEPYSIDITVERERK